MQRNILFILFSFFLIASIFLSSCAGTKKNDDNQASDDKAQQQDLDDIEALLGISSDTTPQQKTPPPAQKNRGEKLDLLENEVGEQPDNSMASAALAQEQQQNGETEKYKKEVNKLKSQLKQKEQRIASLENEVALKENELENLSSRPSISSYSTPTGDISMEAYKDNYDQARASFEARNYAAAIEQFEALLASSSRHSLSDNAQYWIGESHFALRQYDSAIIDFEKVLTFPKSNKKADAQFKLGFCYLLKGDKAKAVEEFNRLQANYPDSKLNTRVDKLLAKY